MIKPMIYEQQRHARLNLIPQREGEPTDSILKEARGQFGKLQIGDESSV